MGSVSDPPPPLPSVASDDDDSGFEDFLQVAGMSEPHSSPPAEQNRAGGGGDSMDNEASDDEASLAMALAAEKRRVSWKPDLGAPSKPADASALYLSLTDAETQQRRDSLADSVVSFSSEDNTKASTQSERRGSECSVASRRSSSFGTSMDGVWGKLMNRKSEIWDDDISDMYDFDDDAVPTSWQTVKHKASQTSRWLRATLKTAFSSKQVAVPCLLLFALLVGTGFLITWGFDTAATNARKDRAVSIARSTDLFFVRVLENAFVPLFTISQFVHEVELFETFDSVVGERCDPNATDCSDSTSAPVLTGKEQTHRNVTGIFETESGSATLTRFEQIARGIKENSGLGKSLVSIQLAPKGVVSLFYPMVNCEDFSDGYCLNNTGAWGHDLLNDPNRTAIASKTVPADGVVTAGPLKLIQGEDTVIARLPINFDEGTGHSMVVDGVDYPCWGFAVVLLNWKTLKEDSNIYNEFKDEAMQFLLTRTDVDKDTGEETVVIIAQSDRPELIENDNVTLSLNTGDNGWVISVGYDDGFSPNYKAWALPIVFFSAFSFSLLMMLVLVSKKEHERLLGNLMPARAINKLRKGETVVERYAQVTIFFSDIVGYTNMSSQMTPVEVMQMLSDLYSQMDVLAKKHNVYKVETIGDAYIAIAGAPKKCTGPEAAEKMTLFALDALHCVRNFKKKDDGAIAIRVGLASGPVVAGVIGTSLPKYTLFGDTVNFAARMEHTSKKMQLQICPLTQRMLLDAPTHDFKCEERYDDEGNQGIELKGKGRQYAYWVTGSSKLDEKRARKRFSFENGDDNA